MAELYGLDTLGYSFADESNVSAARMLPEQILWCAVISQAMTDAGNGSAQAREWLLFEREDFALVCTLAGLSPLAVRRTARRIHSPKK